MRAERSEMQVVPTKVPTAAVSPLLVSQAKLLRGLEARAGIEPAHKGFAVDAFNLSC
jgi:hypothetical protein